MSTDTLFWDRIAESYSKSPVANPSAFERKIEVTKARMRGDHTVLDIGCGTGSLALRLADVGATVHGLDLSVEMIRIARAKAQAAAAGNVTFHVGAFDSNFDTFDRHSLDGICAYSLLHLVPDRRDALARIHRLLKPGGFFVSSTACLGESWVPYTPIIAVMRLIGKAPKSPPVAVIRKATLAAELESVGFVDISQPDVGAGKATCFMVATKA